MAALMERQEEGEEKEQTDKIREPLTEVREKTAKKGSEKGPKMTKLNRPGQ